MLLIAVAACVLRPMSELCLSSLELVFSSVDMGPSWILMETVLSVHGLTPLDMHRHQNSCFVASDHDGARVLQLSVAVYHGQSLCSLTARGLHETVAWCSKIPLFPWDETSLCKPLNPA